MSILTIPKNQDFFLIFWSGNFFLKKTDLNSSKRKKSTEYLHEDMIFLIFPSFLSFFFLGKNLQKCGRTCAGATGQKTPARTHFARTISKRLRTSSHPKFRTHVCDRTHARTHFKALLGSDFRIFEILTSENFLTHFLPF